jgi:RNA polymerase sigma factor (sigma-70 family)
MTADEATLARLMALAQRGDVSAYRQLLGLCAPLIRRVYARRLPDGALDDLVQETLMSLHRKRDSWDPSRPFLPWIAAIARYRWIDHLRQVYAAPQAELGDDFGIDSGEEAIAARFGCDRLLAMLPSAQAAAIRATRIEGLSTAEAAARLGQSESLVKVNVHRGLKKLAALVEDD